MLLVASATCAKRVPEATWLREVPGFIEGSWRAESEMGQGEGGVCTLTFTSDRVRLRCSPGQKEAKYSYGVATRSSDSVILELKGDGADSAKVELEIESLRNAYGERALRIRDVLQPDAAPLGAYGNPRLWVEAQGE